MARRQILLGSLCGLIMRPPRSMEASHVDNRPLA
jgi:hypothetical protein